MKSKMGDPNKKKVRSVAEIVCHKEQREGGRGAVGICSQVLFFLLRVAPCASYSLLCCSQIGIYQLKHIEDEDEEDRDGDDSDDSDFLMDMEESDETGQEEEADDPFDADEEEKEKDDECELRSNNDNGSGGGGGGSNKTRRSPGRVASKGTKNYAEDDDDDDDGAEAASRNNEDEGESEDRNGLRRSRKRRVVRRGGGFGLEPTIGMKFRKKFDDGEYYVGTIVEGPQFVEDKSSGEIQKSWNVKYDDGDEEDLTLEELETSCSIVEVAVEPEETEPGPERKIPKTKSSTAENNAATEISVVVANDDAEAAAEMYERAKAALLALPSMTEDEVLTALDMVGPPYGMQEVTASVHGIRDDDKKNYATFPAARDLFRPEIGLRVRKLFDGRSWYGRVTKDAEMLEEPSEIKGVPAREVQMWEVTYDDDGDVEDMTWEELYRNRADRPIRSASCRGRVLQSLELFSGE